jgi:hypothetical protein
MHYMTYKEVPWYRREPGAVVLFFALWFTPVTVVLCFIALTGDVYKNSFDSDGNLQVWGRGNRVAAVLLLVLHTICACFCIPWRTG